MSNDLLLQDENLKKQRIKILYQPLIYSSIGQVVVGLILVYVLQDFISSPIVISWLIGLLIVNSCVSLLHLYFNKKFKKNSLSLKKWENIYFFFIVVSALVWGCAGVFLYPDKSAGYQMFLELTIAGIVMASISIIAASIRAIILFIVITLVPVATKILLLGTDNHIALTTLVLTFMVISLVSAFRFNRYISDNLKLHYNSKLREKKLFESEEKFKSLYNQAEKANQAKSDFLANMSHEIRTPMNGIIGNTSMLLLNSLSDKQKQRATSIKNSADSMLLLVNDILDFSKIEAGMLSIEHHPFNFENFMDTFSSSIVNSINEKGLDYSITISPQLKRNFKGDLGRIKQILTNLVSNSVKFTHHGSISINCFLNYANAKYSVVQFDVIDTGIGVSKEQQETIFERFTQADGSTTRKYGGTGLGLSICKQLTELMGGNISFNQVENGTSISFTVRLNNVDESEVLKQNKLNLSAKDSFNANALIVEDNVTNQLVAKDMLETLGLNVEIASNGKKSLQLLKEKPYDIVFMDCHMPVMDGYQTTKLIRDKSTQVINHKIPIVAMTASAMSGDKEKCLNSGMDDYITKPLNISLIKQKLNQWLYKPSVKSKTIETPIQAYIKKKEKHKESSRSYFAHHLLNLRLSGNSKIIKKVCDEFIKSTENSLISMEKHIKSNELNKAQKIAHTLKGASANVGCTHFNLLIKEIERQLKNQNASNTKQLLSELNNSYLETKKAIDRAIG